MTRITIIGAGIAGLTLAQCLRRRQIPAIIFEKSKQFPPQQNFGITLFPSTYHHLLQTLSIDRKGFVEAAGIGGVDNTDQSSSSEASLRVNRPALLRFLAKDLDIRWNHHLTDLKSTNNSHELVFSEADQNHHECDVVIIADGVHSSARKSLNLDNNAFQLQVLPYIVYNGKRRFQLDQAPSGLRACLKDVEGLRFRQGDTLLQITSGYLDKSAQELAINYTLSRPAKGSSDEELLQRSNSDAELLARKFLEEAGSMTDLPEPFKTVFDPKLMKNDRLLHWLMRSALIDESAAHDLAKSRIEVIGDAAHPVPILGGAGANNAILDAVDLANTIANDTSVESSRNHASWKQWKDQSERSLERMHQSEKSVI